MKVKDETALVELGAKLGARLKGGEVIELIGDIGAGKTTFVKGIGAALGVKEPINSPSFTVMKQYSGVVGKRAIYLKHYDFYRLDDAGLMKHEIVGGGGEDVVTVVEWAKDVAGVLPEERLKVEIEYLLDVDGREVKITGVKI
jgi:tRNA threonylcarbamoyladenosine biosynthesis protein TsaE